MKKTKRILCAALAAIIFACVPLTAFASGTENMCADVSADGILNAFWKAFAAVRYIAGEPLGFNKTEHESCPEFAVPALELGFIPQGLCYVESIDSFAVCGYTDNGTPSILAIIGADGSVKTLRLRNIGGTDYTGHAGGVASDGRNLFITSGKYAHRLRVSDIAAAKDGDTMRFVDKFNTGTNASFCFCDDDMLWVGEFATIDGNYNTDEAHHTKVSLFEKSRAWCVGFKIDGNAENSIGYEPSSSQAVTPDCILTLPNKVQGFARLPDGSFAVSISYGRQFDSYLKFYPDVTAEKPDGYAEVNGTEVPMWYLSTCRLTCVQAMPAMMQGLDVVENRVYTVFESCAEKYSDAVRVVNDVWSFELK